MVFYVMVRSNFVGSLETCRSRKKIFSYLCRLVADDEFIYSHSFIIKELQIIINIINK